MSAVYISRLFGDDVSGLVELHIYIYLGCLGMIYLVWLSAVYISRFFGDDVSGLVERCMYI